MSGRTIYEVPLVSEVQEGMKFPISDGSNLPQTASVKQINAFITKKVQEFLIEELSSYVKKESGKGLSTNDFTTELKNKLNGLKNYDDSLLVEQMSQIQNILDSVMSGNSSKAIESFNEIVAFLKNIQDNETLEGIVGGISTKISGIETKLSELGSEVKENSTLLKTIKEVVDFNSYTQEVNRIYDGQWTSDPSYYRHYKIPVIVGQKIYIKANSEKETAYAFLASSRTDIVDYSEQGTKYLAAGKETEVEVPIGTKFLYIYSGFGATLSASLPSSLIISGIGLVDRVEELFANTNELGANINENMSDISSINATIKSSDNITPQIIKSLYISNNTILAGSVTLEIHYHKATKDEIVIIECEVATSTPTGCIFIVDDIEKINAGYIIENLIQPNVRAGERVTRAIKLKEGQIVALSTYRDQSSYFGIYNGKDRMSENEERIKELETKRIKTDNIEDKAITIEKIAFTVTSENVVDWQNLDIRDWSLSSAVASTSYKATDFILLKANTTYTCNVKLRRVYTFEKYGAFEDTVSNVQNPAIQSLEEITKFTTGDTDVYVRLMVQTSLFNIGAIMLVEGEELPGEYVPYKVMIDPNLLPLEKQKKKITAVGSSGLARSSGGQWCLTDTQKSKYGVSTDLTMTRVLQVLLEYDKSNIIAEGGNTASNSMFMCGLSSYILLNSFVLKADKSNTQYLWSTESIAASMTENLNTIGNVKGNGVFNGIINGISVYVNPSAGTIAPTEDLDSDITIPANGFLTREPRILAEVDGNVMDRIQDSYGLILQIGANNEGATPEELINYFELAIKASGCSWFICLPKNGAGIHTTSELNNAIPLLKKKFGSRFIDHRPYMCSLKALNDQGITPTTSEAYPDINGINSNPLTENQIANNVPCDMQCIAEGRYPSSFWHSAYRDNETNNQTINATHFNAQGLECLGKYLYNMIKLMKIE